MGGTVFPPCPCSGLLSVVVFNPLRDRHAPAALYWKVFSATAVVASVAVAMAGSYVAFRAGSGLEHEVWAKLELAAASAEMRLGGSWPANPPANAPKDLAPACRELSDASGCD